MARTKSCHSPLEAGLEVRRDTMPVRPSKDPTEESLSHHGETEALMDLEVAEEEVDTEMMRGSPDESQGRQEEGEGGSDTEEGEDVM